MNAIAPDTALRDVGFAVYLCAVPAEVAADIKAKVEAIMIAAKQKPRVYALHDTPHDCEEVRCRLDRDGYELECVDCEAILERDATESEMQEAHEYAVPD